MKPEKRPASKKPNPRKTKAQIAEGEMHRNERSRKLASMQNAYGEPPALQAVSDMGKINEYAKTSFDPAYLKLRKVELNFIQRMKTKYLLIGILIGIGIGYGLHSAVTWV